MNPEILETIVYLDCPNCREVPEGQEPIITTAALVDDTEVWCNLRCPVCNGQILLVVTFAPEVSP